MDQFVVISIILPSSHVLNFLQVFTIPLHGQRVPPVRVCSD